MKEDKRRTMVISIGSNTPDAPSRVATAIEFLMQRLDRTKASTVYSTPPLGKKHGAMYSNAVVEGELPVATTTEGFNAVLKEYERNAGRRHEESNGEVAIDLDIVIDAGRVIRRHDFEAEYFTKGFKELNCDASNDVIL